MAHHGIDHFDVAVIGPDVVAPGLLGPVRRRRRAPDAEPVGALLDAELRLGHVVVEIRRQGRELVGDVGAGLVCRRPGMRPGPVAAVVRLKQAHREEERIAAGAIPQIGLGRSHDGLVAVLARPVLAIDDVKAVGQPPAGDVPLPRVHRLIAAIPQPAAKVGQVLLDGRVVVDHRVLGRHPPREPARARRAADRIGAVRLAERRALACQAVDVRRVHIGAAVSAERLHAELIDVDEQDVGLLALRGCGSGGGLGGPGA